MKISSDILFGAFEGAKAHVRRVYKSSEIRPVRVDRTLAAARIVVISPVCNESHRLDFFVDYYRRLGVDHFIFVDNLSTDGIVDLLAGKPDISIFEARGLYSKSRYAVDWVNHILNKYCAGKWILHVDADEMLVFPDCETAGLPQLCRHLEAQGLRSLNAMLVDMYSDKDPDENHCASGQDPLTVCPLFDAGGYEERCDRVTRTRWIKGGVRGRVYFSDAVWSGPALNKTPLVLWKKSYAFLKSAHEVWPWHLNTGARESRHPLTGALLHFKFTSSFSKILAQEAERQQHTTEYAAYSKGAQQRSFVGTHTKTYRDSRSLSQCGIMQGGGWRSLAPDQLAQSIGAVRRRVQPRNS